MDEHTISASRASQHPHGEASPESQRFPQIGTMELPSSSLSSTHKDSARGLTVTVSRHHAKSAPASCLPAAPHTLSTCLRMRFQGSCVLSRPWDDLGCA
eukprot:1160423-Pelagomonas_calceolata.AAC.12